MGFKQDILLFASAETSLLAELSTQSAEGPLREMALGVGQNTFSHLQLNMIAHYGLGLLHTIP